MKNLMLQILIVVCVLAVPARASAQQRQITGHVASAATGDALPGASVIVRGTTLQAVTDEAGNFAVRAPAGEVVLVVRTIGYRTREIMVPADAGSASVSLDVDVLGLDELVVTGRATSVARRNLANAVASVRAAELERAPSAETVEKMLQGRVPGASIETNSGAPGGGVQVRLRGVSTVNAQNEPLYVVDGVIVSNVGIPSNQNAVTKAASGSNPSLNQDAVVNRIVDLNPEEIESIEILKGASAAAIYGSKAAAGVVIISTKRGRPGKARFSLTQRLGVFDLSNKLGSRTFETVEEATKVWGPAAADVFQAQAFDQEELLAGRHDLSSETSFSVSGGGEATRYYASGLWKNDEGVIANTGFEKQSFRLNLDQRVGSRLDLGLSTNLIHTVAERGLTNNDNNTVSFYMTLPFTPSFVDLQPNEQGVYPKNPFALPGLSNPLQTAALMKNQEDVWRFVGAGRFTLDLLHSGPHSVQVRGIGGVDYFAQENDLLFPPELVFEPLDDGLPGTKLLSNSSNRNLNASGDLIHVYSPAAGSFTATTSAGLQYEDRDLGIARIVSRNLTAGKDKTDAGTTISITENRQRVKDMGMYVQEEVLTLEDRLLVTAGLRAERSSANGEHDKFFVYPKAAASYRLSDVGAWVDDLKLRAAWGQSGNQPLFGQKFTPLIGNLNIGGIPGVLVAGVAADARLEPERQTEVEGGFDAALFDERATLEVTLYQKNTTNLLLQRTTAPSTGFTAQIFNGGKLRGRGVEIALGATPIRSSDFSWVTRATFFRDRGEVTELPVPTFRVGGFGTSLGQFQIEKGKSPSQIVTNLGRELKDGQKVTKVGIVGDANPDFRMGFTNDLTYKNLNLNFLWDWSKGATIINLTEFLYDLGGNTVDYEDEAGVTEEDLGDKIEGSKGERRFLRWAVFKDSRPYMEDGTYLKLREVSLSWRVPDDLVSRWFRGGVRTVRLTASGRNLITITDYTGLDPEVSNFGNQAVARNIDVAPFPPSRSFWFSVDVSF